MTTKEKPLKPEEKAILDSIFTMRTGKIEVNFEPVIPGPYPEKRKKIFVKNPKKAKVLPDACQCDKCKQECLKACPMNVINALEVLAKKPSSQCIIITQKYGITMADISEDICTGCGRCMTKCPFDAIDLY